MKRGMSRWLAVAASGLIAVAGCSGGSDDAGPATSSGSTVADTVRGGTPDSLVPASSLAASQVTASTVPRPSVPPRCAPRDLAIWTAQVRPYDGGADGVLRVRNVGSDWCEVDLSGSPRLDPGIEPDVWLEPGEWAELVVGPSRDACGDAEVVTLAEMTVGGEPVEAPTTAITSCGWSFVAMFPLDTPASACTELETAVTDRWLVVRNSGAAACSLTDLVAVGDLGVAPRSAPSPAVTALDPGDVAGYPLAPADGCAGGPAPLSFEGVGDVVEVTIEPCVSIDLGPAWPVLAGTSGLLGDLDPASPLDAAAIFAGFDPFVAR